MDFYNTMIEKMMDVIEKTNTGKKGLQINYNQDYSIINWRIYKTNDIYCDGKIQKFDSGKIAIQTTFNGTNQINPLVIETPKINNESQNKLYDLLCKRAKQDESDYIAKFEQTYIDRWSYKEV